MSYLGQAIEGQEAIRAALRDPFAPAFPEAAVERATRLEIWNSSLLDPGDDFSDWVLFDDSGEIARRRVSGY